MDKYRVVLHLDEGGKAKGDMVFRNIENLLNDLGEDNVQIELVTNGEGVIALFKSLNWHGDQVTQLAARGVRFVACAQSLRQLGIAQDALLDTVEMVPTGVGELVRKQAEEWAYIRP